MEEITVSESVEISRRVARKVGGSLIDPVDVYMIVRLIQRGEDRAASGVYGWFSVEEVRAETPGRLLPEGVGS